MKILATSSNPKLSENVARRLGEPFVKIKTGYYPDGQFWAKDIEDIDDETIVLIGSTHPADKAMEFFLLAQYADSKRPKELIGVVPYAGQMRQDRPEKNEANFARAMVEHTELYLDEVIFVNPHSKMTMKSVRTARAKQVSAMPEIGKFVKELGVDFVVSPDHGSLYRAEEVARVVGCEFDYFDKTRISGSGVNTEDRKMDVRERKVAIVDDIIATGATIIGAAKHLRKQGAREIIACCVHGVFVYGPEELQSKLDGLYASDTIQYLNPIMYSAAEPIAKALNPSL